MLVPSRVGERWSRTIEGNAMSEEGKEKAMVGILLRVYIAS